jgi:hypothetical protein
VQDFGSRLKNKISSTFRRKKNQDNSVGPEGIKWCGLVASPSTLSSTYKHDMPSIDYHA